MTNILGFGECSSLTDVYYGGQEEDKKRIEFNLFDINAGIQGAEWHYESSMPVTIESITIKTKPQKTEYKKHEEINLDGLVLNVTHSDGTVSEMSDTDKISVNKYNAEECGSQTIQLEYEGCCTYLDVNVKLNLWQRIGYTFSYKRLIEKVIIDCFLNKNIAHTHNLIVSEK